MDWITREKDKVASLGGWEEKGKYCFPTPAIKAEFEAWKREQAKGIENARIYYDPTGE